MGLSPALSKTPDALYSGSPNSMRAASTPAWRIQTTIPQASSSPPYRTPKNLPLPAQPLVHSPSTSVHAASKTPPSHLSSAPMIHKSRSTHTTPSSSTHPSRAGLGPVISPPKVKAGLTATRHASYVSTHFLNRQEKPVVTHMLICSGNAWNLAPVEPISKPSSSAPVSFAEIQQLQSQPNIVVKERRSLLDIQAEEAELQAEVEFMKWWTAEEERIRLENEAMLASLEQQPKKPRQVRHRHLGKTNKKSVGTSGGDSRVDQRATSSGERGQKTTERVPDTTKGTSRG